MPEAQAMLDALYTTFLIVAETGSFSKAAGRLYLSPVAVMNQMNELETKTRATLFVRTNRGVVLTHAGQILLTETMRIKKEADEALKKVQAAAQKDKFPIRVGSSMMRPAQPLMNICQSCEEIQRKFVLQIIPFSDNQFSGKWLKSVIGTEFDCITSPYDVRGWYDEFQVLKLGEEKFKLAVPFAHPMSKLDFLRLADLTGCTIVTPSRLSPLVDELCTAVETSGFDIHVEPLPGFYTANTFFEHTGEILLTRDSFNVISSGFKAIPVEWDFVSPTGIIYSRSPSKHMEEFAALLKQAIV
jgi:DNA-binding transcriptional LysR family regulator